MKILIVDDHPLTCQGLAALLLSALEQAEVISAHSADAAQAELGKLTQSDWIFLDINLTDDPDKQFFSRLCSTPWIKRTLLISAEPEHQLIQTALAAGARGFLPKTADPRLVLEGFEKVRAGDVFLPPALMEKLRCRPLDADLVRRLSPRLQQIQDRLLRGVSNKVIARELGLSTYTVKEYVSTVLAFNGVNNRLDLVLKQGKSSQ